MGFLPNLSATVGQHTRTNSEIICGARSRTAEVDHSKGIAIASDVQADAETHIQIVRYPAGSGLMGLLGTLAAPGGGKIPRALRWIGCCLRSPLDLSFSFASEQAIDQLAYLLKMDPYDFRQRNIKEIPSQVSPRLQQQPHGEHRSNQTVDQQRHIPNLLSVHISGFRTLKEQLRDVERNILSDPNGNTNQRQKYNRRPADRQL